MNNVNLCKMKAVKSSDITRVRYIKECMKIFNELRSTNYWYHQVHNDLYNKVVKAESKGLFFAHWSDPILVSIVSKCLAEDTQLSWRDVREA